MTFNVAQKLIAAHFARPATGLGSGYSKPGKNIAKLAEFAFAHIDTDYPQRARQARQHAIVGGSNYGQGSSREHAAIVPRYLGLRLVIAKSYARIHWQNLVNFGILPLEFTNPADYQRIQPGHRLTLENARDAVTNRGQITHPRHRHRRDLPRAPQPLPPAGQDRPGTRADPAAVAPRWPRQARSQLRQGKLKNFAFS